MSLEDIDKLEEIFLSDDVDEEDRQDNIREIADLRKSLLENENLLSWQGHEVTKGMMKLANDSYVEVSLKLATDRTLDDQARTILFAKQDAMRWILSFAGDDAVGALKDINDRVKVGLSTSF